MVMISAFQAEGPGSIPGRRINLFVFETNAEKKLMEHPGFDPGTSSLLTTHSSDWANAPHALGGIWTHASEDTTTWT